MNGLLLFVPSIIKVYVLMRLMLRCCFCMCLFKMPELPEVETTRRGIEPHIQGNAIERVEVRCPRLRWPIPDDLNQQLAGQTVQHVTRRGKYLLLGLDVGTLMIHLGMSGRLCFLSHAEPPQKHDHVDIIFKNQAILRYTDPRRFGAILLTRDNPEEHVLLKKLGVEPLTEQLTADYLLQRAKNRRVAIKPLIMDSQIVVGVGNIYAAEALFLAGIHPKMPASHLAYDQSVRLVVAIKQVLAEAITQGGTTLKDFLNSDGRPGYFAQKLHVYGRGGLPCVRCKKILESCVLGQRSTVYCAACQPL